MPPFHKTPYGRRLLETLDRVEAALDKQGQRVFSKDEHLVTVGDVLERIPIHRSTLNAMITAKRFPPPIRLTSSKLLWRWSVIAKWIQERERTPLVDRRQFRFKPGDGRTRKKPKAAKR